MFFIFKFYFFIISIITFAVFGLDKHFAKTGKWRVSEAVLLTLCIIGGSIGGIIGMVVFHHKTNHKKFTIGVPVIIAAEWILHIINNMLIFYALSYAAQGAVSAVKDLFTVMFTAICTFFQSLFA